MPAVRGSFNQRAREKMSIDDAINELVESAGIEDDLMDFEEEASADPKMAIADSENFTVYSDIHFLYLCGKFAASSKSNLVDGLRALNDYVLILDYARDAYHAHEYEQKRALALYQIGVILSLEPQTQGEGMTYLLLAIEDLRSGSYKREVTHAESLIAKHWQ